MNPVVLTRAYQGLVRPVLFRAYGGDPEAIHEVMLKVLAGVAHTPLAGVAEWLVGERRTPVTVAGVRFPGRVGVAAGLDKDGVAARAWACLGFGFAELGTVTATGQPGNPRPRLYRVPDVGALVNHMGFNNAGAAALAARLAAWGVRRGEASLGLPLGISLGKTKTVPLEDAAADYVSSLTAVHPYADYIALNVSSPNTPGLRDLQAGPAAAELVGEVVRAAARLDTVPVPVFVKVAPDLTDAGLDAVLDAACGAGAAGFIATNTTLAHDGPAGGLSGAPLRERAREVVARVVRAGRPVIASGGIMTPADAGVMLDLGAVAVQVFTGFIYAGPGLVAGINRLANGRLE